MPGRDRSIDRSIGRSANPIEDGVRVDSRLFDVARATLGRRRDRRGRRARGGDRTRGDDIIHTRARIYTLTCAREREREDEDDERARVWIATRRLESIDRGSFEVDLISRG